MTTFKSQNFSTCFNFTDFSSRLNEPEAKLIIVDIANEVSTNQVVKPDIEDDQKRWLIVGICLHSVISPALRKYIPPVVSQLYNKLKQTDKIDAQSFAQHMKRYKPTNKELNYEAINNNSAIPKVKGKKDEQKYNYNVTSDVDLTKLFLATSMAHYTGFDDTCDSSALLGIIVNIDSFQTLPKQTAEKVRSDIRNPWAHCNFSEWDVIKYQNSFQLMNQFIRNLLLPIQDETAILGHLLQWQTNGLQFLQGTTLGVELIQDLKKETRALSKYILDIVLKNDMSFQDVHRSLLSIEGSLNKTSERVDNIETESLQLKTNLQSLTDTVTGLQDSQKENYESVESTKTEIRDIQSCMALSQSEMAKSSNKVTQLESRVDNLSLDVYGNESDLNDMQSEIIYARTEINHTNANVNSVKNALKETQEALQKSTLNLQSTKADCAKNTADIANINQYLSNVRPSGKVFFYPPDRISTFVSREEQLEQLRDKFNIHSSETHTQVICGLGGIGKTTLAVEYAWTFQAFYPGGVFWMSAETNEALEDSVQRLAIDTNTVGKNAKETLVKTLKWLSCIQDGWLLVIDNVDMDDIQGSVKEILLQSWKRGSKGHIIITSRREAENAEETFYVRLEDCISLEVLNREESVEFMIISSECQTDKNDDSLIELAEELGGLPLALEQAAAHIKVLHCSFSEYLKKFHRKRLGVLRGVRYQYEISKERLAVQTTWQLNFDYIKKQSNEAGLGNAAITVMEISAFLHADNIPMILFNVGSPHILDDDLVDTFQEELGIKQVAEILARFSLFDRCSTNSLNVHRLVQDVIRQSMKNTDRKAFILQSASRMVNLALGNTHSPMDVLKDASIGRASLQMWSKLAVHANTLKTHFFDFTKRQEAWKHICFNIETAKILQTSAIYHSLYQRQDEALACQAQMLSILPALSISEHDYNHLTRIKIPLLQKDRLILQKSITIVIPAESVASADSSNDLTNTLLGPELLHQLGNDAFKTESYQVAIQCYSEAITAGNESLDIAKYLANRSLAYLKICDYENALRDADKCIEIDPNYYKAYCWKAYAISYLIRLEILPKSWESAGLAAAAVAGHLNKQCLLEYWMKIEYPLVRYKIITNESELGGEISSIMNRTNMTLLLRRGRYQIALDKGQITTKSVQIIGIEDGVEIESPLGVLLINPKKSMPLFQIESKKHVYFENVTFPNETGQIEIKRDVNAIFYRCRFSNGKKACENFPFCEGKTGCVNPYPDECRSLFSKQRSFPSASGASGHPGICAIENGSVLLDRCVLDRCGGGGTLSIKGAVLNIKNSIIRNMRQMGIEARDGGITFAENCLITDNQYHGVAIGPKGEGHVKNCIIQNNKNEGIWCGSHLSYNEDSFSKMASNSAGGSTCYIFDNLIYQNGMSGISLDGGSYDVSGNRIFDNWLWGMMVKFRSTTNICNNDIFENKCGGIRIGVNYSATVVFDGNSVRDHTGPAIHTETCPDWSSSVRSEHALGIVEIMKSKGMLDDEITIFAIPPIITSRNVIENNNRGQQHPRKMSVLLENCCFCHAISKTLKKCSKCKKASYCSKECQAQHWKRHKAICKHIVDRFTVDIKMSDTEKWNEFLFGPGMTGIRRRNAPLPGLGEGQPPDKLSEQKFIVKIQSGFEYTPYNPNKDLRLYDQTQTLDIFFRSPEIYHLVCECGVLAASRMTTKKMFCWASFKSKGSVIRIYIDNLPPFQTW